MRNKKIRLGCFLLARQLVLGLTALMYPLILSASNQLPIILSADFKEASIANQVAILEDDKKTFTIDQILSFEDYQFQAVHQSNLSFGPRRNSNIWVKIPLENRDTQRQALLLTTGNEYIRYIDAYMVQNNKILHHYRGGMQENFSIRPLPYRYSVFPLTLTSQAQLTVYLKIDWKWDSGQIPLLLQNPATFYTTQQKDYLRFGVIIGLLLVVIVSALIFWVSTRNRLFLFYFLYFSASLVFITMISGLGYQYLLFNYPRLAHHASLIFGVLAILSFYMIIVTFHQEGEQALRFGDWHTKIVGLIGSISLLIAIFQDWILENDFIPHFPPGIAVPLIMLIILYLMVRMFWVRKSWTNLVFMLGFSGWLFQGLIFTLLNNGILEGMWSQPTFLIFCVFLELSSLAILMGYNIYKAIIEKQQLASEIATARLEKQQAEKIKALDLAKTRLYTNITHEFRTPLTVIQGLASQLEGNARKKELINRNSNILLNLVNQLLDLSKADKGELKLQLRQDDIIPFLNYLSESFGSWAITKNIRLHFLPEIENCWMDFDAERMQEVISNLLSNAIKYTGKNGDIYLFVRRKGDQLNIEIKDTGQGITAENVPYIFDRFYQVDNANTTSQSGSGIGLALCKELVQLMNGTITVKSKQGVGSQFFINLPITNKAKKQGSKKIETTIPIPLLVASSNDATLLNNVQATEKESQPTILIVEDNADVRHYIKICLEANYQLLIAENGQQGIETALTYSPDLILSDVMMPGINGHELCKQLKENIATSHIPIILLTAKAGQQSKLEGLTQGADAYLTKPFNKEELTVRISQLIAQRKRIQIHFSQQNDSKIDPKYAVEHQFLQQLRQIILENLTNELFDVQHLSRDIGLSRSQVYRKLKALTGRSIADYIRFIRLQEGKKMLETTTQTVSEITYAVGFKDLSYFSSSFSQEFGYPPNETRK